MNIIYLGNNDPRYFKRGVENVILSQSKAYEYGLKYYVFFGENDDVFRWDNLICISIKNNWCKYLKYNLIIKKIKRWKHCIIHSHGPIRTLTCIYPTDILTVHDAIYYQRKGLNQKFYPIFYFLEKFAYSRSKKIHFISCYSKRQALLTKTTDKKCVVVYNTTPIEHLIESYKKSQLTYCNTHPEDIILLAVRGIEERTRIDILIDFAEYMQSNHINGKNIKILVAGKGHLFKYYKDVIAYKNLQNIELLGYVSDENLAELYNTADCIILTCDHAEGFGLPIIEAYCANKPVIASNKCAVPEIIIKNKYLFENNSTSIHNTLSSIDINEHNFREYYINNFSNTQYIKNFQTIYYDIISTKNSIKKHVPKKI